MASPGSPRRRVERGPHAKAERDTQNFVESILVNVGTSVLKGKRWTLKTQFTFHLMVKQLCLLVMEKVLHFSNAALEY